MRIKQTPNGDYVVDIDKEVLDKLGLAAGDSVYWDRFGKLKAGYAVEKYSTPDGVFTIEINRLKDTQRLIVVLANNDNLFIDLPSVDHVSNLAAILISAEKVLNDVK